MKSRQRIEYKLVREESPEYMTRIMSNPASIVALVRDLQDADREKIYVLLLTSKHKLIALDFISNGTIDRAVIFPRQVVQGAILTGAAAVVLVHNHPSGDPAPSPEDQTITKAIQAACRLFDIHVLDHVIVGEGDKYASFAELGLLQ